MGAPSGHGWPLFIAIVVILVLIALVAEVLSRREARQHNRENE